MKKLGIRNNSKKWVSLTILAFMCATGSCGLGSSNNSASKKESSSGAVPSSRASVSTIIGASSVVATMSNDSNRGFFSKGDSVTIITEVSSGGALIVKKSSDFKIPTNIDWNVQEADDNYLAHMVRQCEGTIDVEVVYNDVDSLLQASKKSNKLHSLQLYVFSQGLQGEMNGFNNTINIIGLELINKTAPGSLYSLYKNVDKDFISLSFGKKSGFNLYDSSANREPSVILMNGGSFKVDRDTIQIPQSNEKVGMHIKIVEWDLIKQMAVDGKGIEYVPNMSEIVNNRFSLCPGFDFRAALKQKYSGTISFILLYGEKDKDATDEDIKKALSSVQNSSTSGTNSSSSSSSTATSSQPITRT